MKDILKYLYYGIIIISIIEVSVKAEELSDELTILGIEPNSGPTSGETRVMARLKHLTNKTVLEYPHPKCRFGSMETEVDATFVRCTPYPRKMNDKEPELEEKTDVNKDNN